MYEAIKDLRNDRSRPYNVSGIIFKKLILFPGCRIINDIILDTMKFLIIPDYMIMKTGLPSKW